MALAFHFFLCNFLDKPSSAETPFPVPTWIPAPLCRWRTTVRKWKVRSEILPIWFYMQGVKTAMVAELAIPDSEGKQMPPIGKPWISRMWTHSFRPFKEAHCGHWNSLRQIIEINFSLQYSNLLCWNPLFKAYFESNRGSNWRRTEDFLFFQEIKSGKSLFFYLTNSENSLY